MSAAPDLPPERLPGVSGARTYKALDDQTVLEALTPQVAADPGTCPHPVMCQTARLTAPDGSVTTILRCPECGHENVWNDPPPRTAP